MRILVLTNMYPPHHIGGYELSCRDTVERWRARGDDVVVLTSDVRFSHAAGALDERDVRRVLALYWRDGEIVTPSLGERLRIERRNVTALRRTIDDVRPDVVSAWHMGAMSMGLLAEVRRRSIPLLLVISDQWLVYGPKVDTFHSVVRTSGVIGRVIGRVTGIPPSVDLTGSDVAVLYASDWLRRRAESASSLGLPERRAVVHLGIDASTFEPAIRRESFTWKLVCSGRVEERKGIHIAIDALAQLPDAATLDVVGAWEDDDYRRALQARAAALGVGNRVRLLGHVDRQELARHLQDADVYLFPVIWDEPFGMAPIEAMACGTPVVGSATGGSAEFLVDRVNALCAPPGDAGALADGVRALADDIALRVRMVDAGLATASHFTIERYADEVGAWHAAAAVGFATGSPRARTTFEDVIAPFRTAAPQADVK